MNSETRARLERGIAAGVVPEYLSHGLRIARGACARVDGAPDWLIAAVLLREVRRKWAIDADTQRLQRAYVRPAEGGWWRVYIVTETGVGGMCIAEGVTEMDALLDALGVE